MTGEFLYPLIQEMPSNLRGRRTRLRVLLSLVILGYYLYMQYRARSNTMNFSCAIDTTREQKIMTLQGDIQSTDAQSRYRRYQILLRQWIQQQYDIDIQSVTLADLELVHKDISLESMHLVRDTYYFPFNMETGDTHVMQQEIDEFLLLIQTHGKM